MRFALLLLTVLAVARAAAWDDRMFAADRDRTAGQYAEAAAGYRAALNLANDDRERAISANNLASLCAELKQFAEARRLYRTALDTWQRLLPPDAPEIATTLNNLGALSAAEHRWRDAAYYYRRSLEIRSQPSTVNNLAEMYRAQGRNMDAEKIYRQLIATLPPDDPALGAAYNNLGELCRHKGRPAEAAQFYQRALEVWERTLGPDHPYKATTTQNLSLVHSSLQTASAASALR